MSEQEPTKEELTEQVRRLQEKLREQNAPGANPGAGGGLAEGVLSALGRMVPGLDKLVELASAMPEVTNRLAAIDEEIKRKFKDQPLRQASAGVTATMGRRQMGIPPSIRRGRPGAGGGVGSADPGRGGSAKGTHRKGQAPGGPRIHISPETPAQLPVDVFDEGDHLAVLVEAPGLQLADFKLSLDGTVLIITVDAPGRAGLQRVELPCSVSGKPVASLAKGVLHIHLKKAKQS